MGYTHYFRQGKNFSNWANICLDVNKVLTVLKEQGIALESNNPSGVMVSDNYINFNGVGDKSHETFLVHKALRESFSFCKTNQKPYDLAVMSALLIMNHHSPDTLHISSDGNMQDWEAAVRFNAKTLGYAFKYPEAIREENEEHALEVETVLGDLYQKSSL